MRLPQRKSEALARSKAVPEDRYITTAKLKRMQEELQDLIKRQRPAEVAEVRRLAELGDFSENAAYQMAKGNLRRINGRITTLEERLKVAIPIEEGPNASGRIRIGSTVTLETNGRTLMFEVLGSSETNPSRGRISYLSPLGVALMGHAAGEEVTVRAQDRETAYRIVSVT